jgi:hypothetical protein
MVKMKIKISNREFATILAALRCYQATGIGVGGTVDIATNGGSFTYLDEDEIDALCEEFNLGKRDVK